MRWHGGIVQAPQNYELTHYEMCSVYTVAVKQETYFVHKCSGYVRIDKPY